MWFWRFKDGGDAEVNHKESKIKVNVCKFDDGIVITETHQAVNPVIIR